MTLAPAVGITARQLAWLWLLVLNCMGLATGPMSAEAQTEAGQRPNLIVILVDDLGVMDTAVPFLASPTGQPLVQPLNRQYRTPHLEKLALSGMRFSQFYAMSVCSPSRVSLLTGQTSARHRVTQWIDPEKNNAGEFGPRDWCWEGLNGSSITLPRILQAAGYDTIHCGKGHFGPFDHPGSDPRQLGFDRSIGGTGAGQPGSYYAQENFGNRSGRLGKWGVPDLEAYHGGREYLTSALTQEFTAAIAKSVDRGRPFFGFLAHYAVHAPFQPDARFADHYPDQPSDLAAFCSMVEGVDESLGALLTHLDQLKISEQTLIVFLGDNGSDSPRGDPFGIRSADPLRGKKGTHFEGGMRVPCLISWARTDAQHPLQRAWPITAGGICRDLSAVYDLAPTLLQIATGQPGGLPEPVDGRSLWSRLAGQTETFPQEFLMHFPHEHRSSYFTVFRQADWKLIYHYRRPAKESFELYNLREDPSESQNRAGTEPDRRRTLWRELRKALKSCDAQFPLADDGTTELDPGLGD